MPDVKGKSLDVAESDIKDAGIDKKVDVVGGGIFGVIVKSNWTVCSQTPPAGRTEPSAPRLTVARSCGDGVTKSPAASSSASPTTSPSASLTASASTSASASVTFKPTQPSAPPTLSAANSPDFAAVLADPHGDCDDKTKAFAKEYEDKPVEFDGRVADMMSHNGDTYVWDILVEVGSGQKVTGPDFKFDGVGILPGDHAPAEMNLPADSRELRPGDKVHLVAKVDHFNSGQCLFFLDPVSTSIR